MAYPSSTSSHPTQRRDGQGNNGPTSSNPVPSALFASLQAEIDLGTRDLDALLGTIAVASQFLTGASGAALAMRRDNAFLCVGRSGETAPQLGAPLRTDSGISGECLRTSSPMLCVDTQNDWRVDAEVCRRLGLRSIAVVPISASGETIGLLEIFGTNINAFTQEHMDILGTLAGLAALATERRSGKVGRPAAGMGMGGRAVAPPPQPAYQLPQREQAQMRMPEPLPLPAQQLPQQPLPPQHQQMAVQQMAAQPQHRIQPQRMATPISKYRRSWIGGSAAAALVLLSILGWRTLRGTPHVDATSAITPTQQPIAELQTPLAPAADTAQKPSPVRVPDLTTDFVVRPASKTEAAPAAAHAQVNQPVVPEVVKKEAGPRTSAPKQQEPEAAPPEVNPNGAGGSVQTLMAYSVPPPKLAMPISQGITPQILEHRVPPVYPRQALALKVEGTVVLDANIGADGRVQNLRVVSGNQMLASAALTSVKQWRYQPALLNGRPTSVQTQITVKFTLPK